MRCLMRQTRKYRKGCEKAPVQSPGGYEMSLLARPCTPWQLLQFMPNASHCRDSLRHHLAGLSLTWLTEDLPDKCSSQWGHHELRKTAGIHAPDQGVLVRGGCQLIIVVPEVGIITETFKKVF
ncbi:unnamed protein product [Lepidochelys olivacea]